MPNVTLTEVWQAYRFAEIAQRFYTDTIPVIRDEVLKKRDTEAVQVTALPPLPYGFRTCTPPKCTVKVEDLVRQVNDTARYFQDLGGIVAEATRGLEDVVVTLYPQPGTCKPEGLFKHK